MKSTFLSFVVFVLLILCSFYAPYAEAKSGCVPGTYLVLEGSGTQSLWTFSKDGTIEFASSAQKALNFSEGHGAWRQTRSREVRVTVLDFDFPASPSNGGYPPTSIGRIDAVISFSKKCREMQGVFELRFFDPETEDPLDPSTDSGVIVSDSFTGRRVVAH